MALSLTELCSEHCLAPDECSERLPSCSQIHISQCCPVLIEKKKLQQQLEVGKAGLSWVPQLFALLPCHPSTPSSSKDFVITGKFSQMPLGESS